ncbi:MAG: type IX secretion system outer membrane channel protein PorV [Rhodothermales bacterium]
MNRRILTALVLGVLVTGGIARTSHAQIGQAAVVFLQIEPDSRGAGMGNTGVALSDNAYSIFWNPAGLAQQSGTELSLTHSNWLPEFNAGLFYEYLVAKHRVEGIGTFGAHLTYLFLGEHECRDEQNTECGTFRSYDLALGASYGTNVTRNLALGTGARLIYSNLAPGQTVGAQETRAGVAVGFDAAALYKVPRFHMGGVEVGINLGANLSNMGPKIQYSDQGQADPIPTNLRFGYAATFEFDEYNKITLLTDLNKVLVHKSDSTTADPFYRALFSSWASMEACTEAVSTCDDDPSKLTSLNAFEQMTLGAGLEYWYRNLFALRAGYFYEHPENGNRKFLTFGSGIRWNIIGVDFSYIYALEENHPLANTMRFSLLLNFLK